MKTLSSLLLKQALRTWAMAAGCCLLVPGLLQAATTPATGLTNFNDNFSAAGSLLGTTLGPGYSLNVGNSGNATGILASGWDFSISTFITSLVSMSATTAGADNGGVSDYCIRLNSLLGGRYVQSVGVRSDDSSGFSLQYVYLRLNIVSGGNADMIITGYKKGLAVSGATLTVTGIAGNVWTKMDVGSNASFANVDEFRFTQAATSSARISYEMVDDISINNAISLPLLLTDFQGSRQGEDFLLTWRTSMQEKLAGFEVQRSADGHIFSRIGWVAPRDSADFGQGYQFLDAVDALSPGMYYYRLKMPDLDGHYTMSPVVPFAASQSGQPGLRVYPNPFRERPQVVITLKQDAPVVITVTDIRGLVVCRMSLALKKGSNYPPMPDFTAWAKGRYCIRVSAGPLQKTVFAEKLE